MRRWTKTTLNLLVGLVWGVVLIGIPTDSILADVSIAEIGEARNSTLTGEPFNAFNDPSLNSIEETDGNITTTEFMMGNQAPSLMSSMDQENNHALIQARRTEDINLDNNDEPVLPSGWQFANSNPEFIYRTWCSGDECEGVQHNILQLVDLATGHQDDVAQTDPKKSFDNASYEFTGEADVAPDGGYVLYGTKGVSDRGQMVAVHIQSLTDAQNQVVVKEKTGVAESAFSFVTFEDDRVTIEQELSYGSGTRLQKTFDVDLNSLEVGESVYAIKTEGDYVLRDEETGLFVQPELMHRNFEVYTYDTSEGLDQMTRIDERKVGRSRLGAGQEDRFHLVDAYETPAGNKVVSVSLSSGENYEATAIFNPVEDEGIRLRGLAETVGYDGKLGTYLMGENNSGEEIHAVMNLDALVSKVPALEGAYRPSVGIVESNDGEDVTVDIDVMSSSSITARYEGDNAGSFGGVYIKYDQAHLDQGDPINFQEAFPGGMVLGLGGDRISYVVLEVKDLNGHISQAAIGYIQPEMQKALVTSDMFDGDADLNAIGTISIMINGEGKKELRVETYGYDYITPILPDPLSTSADVTSLPLMFSDDPSNPIRKRPSMGQYIKLPVLDQVDVVLDSHSELTMNYYGALPDSFGGVFFDYGAFDSAIAWKPTSFEEAFPEGLTLGIGSSDLNGDGISDAESAVLTLTDIRGVSSRVRFNDLLENNQYYVVTENVIEGEADLRNLSSIALGLEGGGDQRINVELGGMPYISTVEPAHNLNERIY